MGAHNRGLEPQIFRENRGEIGSGELGAGSFGWVSEGAGIRPKPRLVF